MSKTIYTSVGAVGTITVTIPANVDISGDSIKLGVGGFDTPPSAWLDPSITPTFSVDGKTATVKLFIGTGFTNPAAGTYWCWYKVTDSPNVDIEPVRALRFTIA